VETSPGEKPDPELHQAMSLIDSDEFGAGEIVSIMQKGYRLHDRLLRPVMVLVAKQESKAQED
jgi:molecular chaperone GrpE